MKKNGFNILFTAFIFLFLIPLDNFAQKKVKNIVVFFSFSPNQAAYHDILEGIKSTSLENAEPRNLIVEYLDIDRSENEQYSRHIVDIYNKKFKDTKIDLLITVGPRLNPLLLEDGFNALKTTPVVDIDLDIPGRITSQDFPNKNRTEILSKIIPGKTLESAFALFPDNKNVFVISGISNTDIFITSLVEKSTKEFEPNHVFKFISGISLDSTIQFAKNIPANSIIIVPNYTLDGNNIPCTTPEVIKIISNNCKAPVFVLSDCFMKNDAGIGGNVFSFFNLGKEAGRIASEILEGKPTKDIAVNESSFYQYIYNWQELKKRDLLDSKAIPNGSIFYNEDISFFTKYEWYIIGILIFIISQALLILYLIRLNRRQTTVNKQKLENERMFRMLIREDRLAKMTEITASLSHELNQPLTAILYSAQAGKRFLQTGKLDLKLAEEIFDNIIEDEKRAAGIIGSVKSLMKLEIKEKEKLNLNELIKETVNILRTELIRNGIKIELKLNNIPVYVSGDKIQLQQVMMNFIKNAMDAMENVDPESKIIEIIQQLSRNSVTVTVRDFGHGIADAFKDNLFKPFVTTNKKGFGIGLALSRSIIEKHEGEIWAENAAGKGAQFSFRLQIVKNG